MHDFEEICHASLGPQIRTTPKTAEMTCQRNLSPKIGHLLCEIWFKPRRIKGKSIPVPDW